MRAEQENMRCASAMYQSRIELENTRKELEQALRLLEEKTKLEAK